MSHFVLHPGLGGRIELFVSHLAGDLQVKSFGADVVERFGISKRIEDISYQNSIVAPPNCQDARYRRSVYIHTATVSGQRGTLLLWTNATCDGKLNVRRCAGCTLNGLGLPQPL